MHLHGHDFIVLGAGEAATFDPTIDSAKLQAATPVRRDTTMLPANGWLVVAFKVDNPGAWLFHCHIAWHVSQGLSVQFLERPAHLPSAMDLGPVTSNCNTWRAYYPSGDPFSQVDSGI